MITNYEHQYMSILKNIYEHGYADGVNERTGISTKRLPGQVIVVDVEKEFPILKSKRVFAKTADREIDWIMRKQSNDIHDLKAKIWDEWADPDGSIGKAYGYQVARPVDIFLDPIHKTKESFRHYDNQVDFVLRYLKENPNGRWAKITLWGVDQLAGMNLVPCCHGTDWNLDGGRLNCVLTQRSEDCKKLARDYKWSEEESKDACQHFLDVLNCNPHYVIPENQTSFWEIDVEQCNMEDYVPVRRVDFGDIAV